MKNVTVALFLLLAGGCANPSAAGSNATVRQSPGDLPSGWSRLKPLFDAGDARIAAHDLAGLKALAPDVNHDGLSLLRANLPNTLARHDVARFLEGRAVFGQALLAFATAVEQNGDAELPGLFQHLADAWYGWMSALQGLPPERAV